MRIKSPSQDFLGINVIPMIDTMMFLLIFFMMAAKFADIERDARVHPPSSRDVRPLAEIPREIVINVTREGSYLVGGAKSSIPEVDKLLERAVRENPHQAVVIRGDGFSILQFAVNILSLCEKHGIDKTYLTTRKSDS